MDKLNRLQLNIEDIEVRVHYLEKKVEELLNHGPDNT